MTEPTVYKKALDKALNTITSAVHEWEQKNSPTVLKASVKKFLDAKKDEIVLKILGFDNTWTKWEINAQGREKSSITGYYIEKMGREAIDAWFSEIKMPEMTATLRKEVEKEAMGNYEYRLREALRELASIRAHEDAKKIIEHLCGSDDLEKQLTLLKLLDAPHPHANTETETK